MLNNKEKIEKLTTAQKQSLLSLSAQSDDFSAINFQNLSTLNTLSEVRFPSLKSLANSWNTALISDIAHKLSATQNAHAIQTPNFGLLTNIYGTGISEDGLICGAVGGAIGEGIARSGAIPVYFNCSLNQIDADYMDINPNENAIKDYVVRPFELAVKTTNFGAISTSCKKLGGEYENVNPKLIKQMLSNSKQIDVPILCDCEDKLKCECFPIIDDETLNTALNERIKLNEQYVKANFVATECKINGKQLLKKAHEESLVLLKNDKSLPLWEGARVAVIGAGSQEFCQNIVDTADMPFDIVGNADGYREDGKRDDLMTNEAVKLAKRSDAVVLLIKPKTKTNVVGASLLALLSKLKRTQATVIGVIFDHIDTSFDTNCDALILADADILPNTIIDVLCGDINPCGRLAVTLYDNVDYYFLQLKRNKDIGNTKVGGFFGYRYYDTAGLKIKYPFGHGLSYSKFVYSNLKINGDTVSFRIKNKSNYDGFETVQLYLGQKKSAIIRPLKELNAFEKVFVKAKKSVSVSININHDLLAVCDYDGVRKTEMGDYIAYVGASVKDIKLKKEFVVAGTLLKITGEKLSDYIQTKSNIISDGYKLNSENPPQKEIEIKNTPALEKLFISEFESALAVEDDVESEEFEEIDLNMTAQKLSEDLCEFLHNRYVGLTQECVRSLVTAIASSNTIVLKSSQLLLPDRVAEQVGKFFRTDVCDDLSTAVEMAKRKSNSLVFLRGSNGSIPLTKRRNLWTFVPSAMVGNILSEHLNSAVFVELKLVSKTDKELFDSEQNIQSQSGQIAPQHSAQSGQTAPQYSAQNTYQNGQIESQNSQIAPQYSAQNTYQNQEYIYKQIPTSQPTRQNSNYTPPKTVSMNQLAHIIQKAEDEFELDESTWKTLDKIEDCINKSYPFRINNALARSLEKYASISLSCGAEPAEALDASINAVLLKHIVMLVNNQKTSADFIVDLESVLGEQNGASLIKDLKDSKGGK